MRRERERLIDALASAVAEGEQLCPDCGTTQFTTAYDAAARQAKVLIWHRNGCPAAHQARFAAMCDEWVTAILVARGVAVAQYCDEPVTALHPMAS